MAEDNHVPTPWVLEEYNNSVSEKSIRIVGANSELVADNEPYYANEISLPNAAYIIKCVNMHDELVSALKYALKHIEYIEKEEWEKLTGGDMARKVLSKL